MKRTSKLSALALVVILAACGGSGFIKSFRVALASSGPLVSSLVASGAIPESKASAIIADFDAGASCGLALQTDFAVIPKDAADAKAQKFTAANKAFQCFRVVVDRQNFAINPRIQQAANIADGILRSLVIFYSDGGTPMRTSSSVVIARDEGDLERQINSQMKALEKAMKP